MTTTTKPSKHQLYYTMEAAIEYLATVLVSGAFLTNMLNTIGVSDAVSGIITSLTVFAQCSQIASSHLTSSKGNLRRKITTIIIINELLFAFLYMVPFFNFGTNAKTTIFVAALISSKLIMNYATPAKLNWLISKIPSESLGDFTAKKEIVSLVSGMAFTYCMGYLSDYFKERGDVRTSFYINAFVICVLCASHIYLLYKCDNPDENNNNKNATSLKLIKETLLDKNFQKLLFIDVFYHTCAIATSFFGVYQLNRLGMSMTAVSVVSILAAFSRALLSLPIGHLADKTSWANMLRAAFGISALSYLCGAFSKPSTLGIVLFSFCVILHSVSLAGINGGLVNITFSYISSEKRTSAIGIRYCVGGLVGFLSTLVGSAIMKLTEKQVPVFFGTQIYFQQIVSTFSALVSIALIIYISVMFCGHKKRI